VSGTIESILVRHFGSRALPGVHSIYLFGSEATGRAHRESDVDVAVLLDRAVHPDRRTRDDFATDLTSELIHVLSRNEVDLIVLNDAPPELGRAVVQRGTRVFCADAEADHAFVRDVQLRAADVAIFLDRMRAIKLARLLA